MIPCKYCHHAHPWRAACDGRNEFDGVSYACMCRFGCASDKGDTGRRVVPAATKRAIVGDGKGHSCAACAVRVYLGGKIGRGRKRLTLDHIVPVSSGGGNGVENLRILCFSCNTRRGNRRPDDVSFWWLP